MGVDYGKLSRRIGTPFVLYSFMVDNGRRAKFWKNK